MEQMHYLKLAYLAESAIVFNLAYTELSWKKEFSELTNKMASLSSLALTSKKRSDHESVCNQSKCSKCDDETRTSSRFKKFTHEHLFDLVKTISSGSTEHDRKSLAEVWQYAECHAILKFFLAWFHYFANRRVDRNICYYSLIGTTIVLAIMTMVDNSVDTFGLLTHAGAWNAEKQWSFWLMIFLMHSMVLPGIFWSFWKYFLRQYECLSISLRNAYQVMSSGNLSDSISNFPK